MDMVSPVHFRREDGLVVCSAVRGDNCKAAGVRTQSDRGASENL